MNFKHKLSRRLAILRTLAVSMSVAIGCTGADGDTVGPETLGDPTAIVAVQIKPPTMTLETGQPGRFTARGYTASGDSTVGLVDWTASGGTITADGVFSSAVAGTYAVVGKKRGRGKQPVDTSIVVVIPPDTSLVAITIAPGQDTLLTSGTQAFTVTGRARDSSTVARIAATWSATGGSIDGLGSYHAGSVAGRYRVIATTAAGAIADTVPVTILSPPPPTLTQVVLTPTTASLATGGSIQFKAYARTSAGDSVAVTPSYTATGGTVSATGLYTAGSTAGTYRVIASSAGLADSAVLTVTAAAPTLTRILLTPASVSVTTGATAQFAAYGRNSVGDSIPVTASFSATGGTITSAGLFTAGAATGNFRVIAVQSGLADTSAVTITSPVTTQHAGYYVAPTGSSSGDGSMSRPWDLVGVLSGSRGVRAGDTVWVRGGTYRSGEINASLSGAIVRAYPGERPAIDGNLYIAGANTTYWGLEIYQSSPGSTSKMGVNVRAPGTRLINNVIHDAGMSGVGFWMEAPNSEAAGNIVYNNGTHGNLDHGFYVQNSSGTKLLRDNLVFNNSAYGFHLYVADNQYDRNVTMDGNVAWNNGTIASARPDFFAGGSTSESGIVVKNNFSFRSDGSQTADLGWSYGATHQDLTFTGNYMIGGPVSISRWTTVTQSGNTVLTSRPTSGTKVVVRPNPYEAGRANVIVYNWSGAGSVSADLSAVLHSGDRYEVRNVQNFAGAPVVSGTYAGGVVSLPMTGTRPPTPLGRTTVAAPTTGPEFDAFVVLTLP